MMTFIMRDENHPTTNVVFHAEVDGEGDLMLFANGVKLLFIAHTSGRLCRMALDYNDRERLPGLKFDEDNRIEVGV